MFRYILSAAFISATPLYAEVPRVVADIAPIQSLVAMVMEGVGEPTVLMKPGASPHHFSMRPSDAAALEKADVVVWMSHDLTPWLEDPIETLASDAAILTLIDHAPVQVLYGAGDDDHSDHDGDHDDHHDEHADDKDGHDDHGDEHAEHDDDHHDEEEHAEGEEGHDDHSGHAHEAGDVDVHAWLNTQNAAHWLEEIAETLSSTDPANAEIYTANAAAWGAKLATAEAEIASKLTPVASKSYAVHHDAFGYFEAQFGLKHVFTIEDGHAVEPGPARIAELQESMSENTISCILTDGLESTSLLETVVEGHQTKIVTADQLGSELTPGPLLYMDLMHSLADAIVDC